MGLFDWKSQNVDCHGSVLFRGSMPPLLGNFTQLQGTGIMVTPRDSAANAHWIADLQHPTWGNATVTCARDFKPISKLLFDFDPRLTDQDKHAIQSAGSKIYVSVSGSKTNVLRDRKHLLRYLQCFMGNDGLIAIDQIAHKFWPREALHDELCHDADLDVESIMLVHLIHDGVIKTNNSSHPHTYWAHTHGLAELGAMDFDILRPSQLLVANAFDAFRAIAFLILEKKVGPTTERFKVIHPGGDIAFVPVAEFNKHASHADRELRDGSTDEYHNSNRLILCEPRKKGFLSRLFGGGRVEPSRTLSQIKDDHMTANFTSAATDLMAARARHTIGVMRQLVEEFAKFKIKPLVKLGYPVDRATTGEREHLWFDVHSFGQDSVNATLLNKPFRVAALREGDRGDHDLQKLTDWTIMTPLGQINPRAMGVARKMRQAREKLREQLLQKFGQPNKPAPDAE